MTIEKGNNFFDNMRAKKKRGEKTAKPGHEDYPSKKQWKDITAKGLFCNLGETCDCCSPMQQATMSLMDSLFEKEKKSKPFHGYNKNKHSRKGGLSAKGRAHFKRKEGANLKPPVTTKPSKLKPGSKKAKRRKSFCARMGGSKGPTSKEGKLTPKGAALKRWNC